MIRYQIDYHRRGCSHQLRRSLKVPEPLGQKPTAGCWSSVPVMVRESFKWGTYKKTCFKQQYDFQNLFGTLTLNKKIQKVTHQTHGLKVLLATPHKNVSIELLDCSLWYHLGLCCTFFVFKHIEHLRDTATVGTFSLQPAGRNEKKIKEAC